MDLAASRSSLSPSTWWPCSRLEFKGMNVELQLVVRPGPGPLPPLGLSFLLFMLELNFHFSNFSIILNST